VKGGEGRGRARVRVRVRIVKGKVAWLFDTFKVSQPQLKYSYSQPKLGLSFSQLHAKFTLFPYLPVTSQYGTGKY
jgi:hypothetical protein